jgi:hypothetical protein
MGEGSLEGQLTRGKVRRVAARAGPVKFGCRREG